MDTPEAESNAGAGAGIAWVVGIGVVALIAFALISTGSLKGGMNKAERHISEMTGGLIGKKPKDGEEHDHS